MFLECIWFYISPIYVSQEGAALVQLQSITNYKVIHYVPDSPPDLCDTERAVQS